MQGVVPAVTQPHVAASVSSAIRSVVHTSPAGHSPPQVDAPMVGPPVAAHGVDNAGWHRQTCAGTGTMSAQQLCPGGHEPPHPGQMLPPHGVGGRVVVVGVSAATMVATSLCTCAAIGPASPDVGHAPPLRASSFAHTTANFAPHFVVSGASPCRIARAVAFSRQRL